METTPIFGLKKASEGDTVAAWHAALNDNMDALDALPVPVASGSNSQLSYQRYADGTLHVWGCVDHGTSYPCTTPVATATGFASATFTLNFPAEFAGTGYSLVASVAASAYPDTGVALTARAAGSVKCAYTCPLNDATAGNRKVLSVDLWGRWK